MPIVMLPCGIMLAEYLPAQMILIDIKGISKTKRARPRHTGGCRGRVDRV